jgi:glycine C-acetyltransferase
MPRSPYADLDAFRLNHNRLGAPGVLGKNVMRYHAPRGPDIIRRSERFFEWVGDRLDAGVYQWQAGWNRFPGTHVEGKSRCQRRFSGLNFTSVDYLGLSDDPRIRQAVIQCASEIGVHSASVAGLIGNYPLSEALEDRLREWFGYERTLLFPTGWAASFGAVVGLVRPYDTVVMDELAHASLQQGAYAATQNVVKFRHLDNESARECLENVRRANPDNGILVITEGMYSMDGDTPDLGGLHAICRAFDATLLVDICHDLGATGPQGTGTIGRDGLLGKVDVVVGALSKSLCTNGGFMLTNSGGAHYSVSFFGTSYTYSTAMTPPQVAAALAAIDIARSAEGEALRQRLRALSRRLRAQLQAAGFEVFGEPDSHIVPMRLGREGLGRLAGARAMELGLVATVIEFPVVPLGAARYRFSMKPSFEDAHVDQAAAIARQAYADGARLYAEFEGRKTADVDTPLAAG